MSKNIVKTNDDFLRKLKDLNIKFIPLEEYKGSSVKIKWLCPEHPRHIFKASPNNIYKGSGCPYCRGLIPLKGETDLWTTHPEVADMLLDESVGYKRSYGSHYKTDWVCPNCGKIIKDRSIKYVVRHGLVCDNCTSNMSYSEKLLASFLNQLKVNYKYDEPTSWSDKRRYDFYIELMSLIIECHGAQHYENRGWGYKGGLDFQIANDKYKKDIALSNGVKHYVQLDCRVSDFTYIKKSILDSELSDLFDLNNFDWILCEKNIFRESDSYYNNILSLSNQGIIKPKEIAEILGIGENTARRYLVRLHESGLSDYDATKPKEDYYRKISQPVRCIETGKVYKSYTEAGHDIGCNPSGISRCCRGIYENFKGLHWEHYDDETGGDMNEHCS